MNGTVSRFCPMSPQPNGATTSGTAVAKACTITLLVGEDGALEVPDTELLRVGSELIRLGVPPDEVLDEYEHLRDAMQPVTERFVAVFDRNFFGAVKEQGFKPEDVRQLAETLDRLRQLATRVVAAAMRHAFAEAAASKLAEVASGVQSQP